jgi:hypothetical protein
MYHNTKRNCVALSAANVITRCDPRTAELVSQCEDEFNNRRRFAAWFDRITLWGTRDVFRMLQDSSGTYPTPKAVMKFILSSTDGVYVVQHIDLTETLHMQLELNVSTELFMILQSSLR